MLCLRLPGQTTVIFARRLWATRVIKKAGFRVRSREARLVIDLLVRTSKTSKGLPTAEQVLFSAFRIFHDKKAVAKQKNLQSHRVLPNALSPNFQKQQLPLLLKIEGGNLLK